MKDIQIKLDLIFYKAGQFNRYQIIIVTLFTLQFICSQFLHNSFTYLTSRPFITINSTIDMRIEPSICNKYFNGNNFTDSIILRKNQIPTTSIILDYEIYCERFKTYLISFFYYLGIIIGSCISYNFYDKIGTKLTLSIFIPSQIICLILFQLLNLDFFKNSLSFLYSNLFILGMCEYIIINILFLYICDIVNLSKIPLFITIIITGRPISILLGIFCFRYFSLNWKTDLAIIAGIDIIIFFFICKYMINSPKVALRNNKFVNFVRNILNISKRNNKILNKKYFDFILPFLNQQEKEEFENIFINQPESLIDNNSLIIDNHSINEYASNSTNIYMYDSFFKNFKKDDIEQKNLKEDYLLSDDNNKIGSVQTLINKTKMSDYSPLDLLKFKTQFINFSILSFLWIVYNFIKYGLDFTANEIPEYNNKIYWGIATHVIGIINLYFIMLMYISNIRAFHKLLISIQLITFISLLLALHLDNIKINKNIYIFSIVVAQTCWNSLYLLLILITILIYPIMLRSKGLGYNIAFGTIGKLVVIFLVDLNNGNEYILFFLFFDFLLLVFSYGLPNRIGSLILDLPFYKETKNNDILENEKEDESLGINENN